MDFSDLILRAYQLIPLLILLTILVMMAGLMIRITGRSTKKTIRSLKK